jgi:hypothetical protein
MAWTSRTAFTCVGEIDLSAQGGRSFMLRSPRPTHFTWNPKCLPKCVTQGKRFLAFPIANPCTVSASWRSTAVMQANCRAVWLPGSTEQSPASASPWQTRSAAKRRAGLAGGSRATAFAQWIGTERSDKPLASVGWTWRSLAGASDWQVLGERWSNKTSGRACDVVRGWLAGT